MESNTNENQTIMANNDYSLPPIELLNDKKTGTNHVTEKELEAKKMAIIKLLALTESNMMVEIVSITIGATVTIFELDVRVYFRTDNDTLFNIIAWGLACLGARVVPFVQGQSTISVEIPNERLLKVHIREVIESEQFHNSAFELPVAIGKTAENEPFVFDLTKTPNLFLNYSNYLDEAMAINAIMASLLYKKHPSQLKFTVVTTLDMLSLYSNLNDNYFAEPQFIRDNANPFHKEMARYAEMSIKSLYAEMTARYYLLKKAACCNIKDYNAKIDNQLLTADDGYTYMPYIVVVIAVDKEYLSLCKCDFEILTIRLAEFGSLVGIHLIIANYEPADILINSLIKHNKMAYITFNAPRLSPQAVVDTPDFDEFTGRGDMLVSMGGETTRVQCAYIDAAELKQVVSHIGNQLKDTTAYILPKYSPEGNAEAEKFMRRDPLFEEAAHYVQEKQMISVPLIQRWFKVGQHRARCIVAQLFDAGIVEPNIRHFKSSKQLNMFQAFENQNGEIQC